MPGPFARLRAFLERVVFAGLKPDVSAGPGPVSLGQKLLLATGIILLGVFVFVLVQFLRKPAQQNEAQGPPPPPVQIVPPGLQIEKNKDLEVVEIEFNKNREPKFITGTLRNRTDRAFSRCEISFHVTARSGSQLGAVDTTVQNVPPHGSVRFRIPVPQKDAEFTMVRELRAE
jgi:hypothetical protein